MRSVLSLSLTALLAAACLAGPYTDLRQRVQHAKSDAEVIRIVSGDPQVARQSEVASTLERTNGTSDAEVASELRAEVELRAMSETPVAGGATAQARAREIKQSPFYRDPGIDQKRNWLADALDRLKNVHMHTDMGAPSMSAPALGGIGSVVIAAVWCVLGIGVVALLYMAAKQINWRRTLKRKATALMEEDEPDRTLDEWLALADRHAAAGRYREAVRALYLACLLRFDQEDVAYFDRGETNWEHLERIETSSSLPRSVDFRTPTQRFDRIWYGRQTEGAPDVDWFRSRYQDLVNAFERVPA